LQTYRLSRLDGAGRINGAEWIDAAGDGDACSKASAQCPSGRYELWQKSRLVDRSAGMQGPDPIDRL